MADWFDVYMAGRTPRAKRLFVEGDIVETGILHDASNCCGSGFMMFYKISDTEHNAIIRKNIYDKTFHVVATKSIARHESIRLLSSTSRRSPIFRCHLVDHNRGDTEDDGSQQMNTVDCVRDQFPIL